MPLSARRLALALAVLLPAAPAVASAQISIFSSAADWAAAVSAPATDSFDDVGPDFLESPLDRTAGGYGYRVSADNGFFGLGDGADRWLSVNTATNDLVFSNFSSTVRGVGGFFFLTDLGGAPVAAGRVEVTLVSGAFSTSLTVENPTTATFLGFTSVDGISSMTVRAVQPAVDFHFATINDLRLAAPATVVPEPATTALVATGLLALAAVARRRRGA